MSVGEKPITDINNYNSEMAKSLIDKIFFMDKIEADLILDIGCADGTLIKFLSNIFPDHQYVGYDADAEMIREANNGYESPNVTFDANIDVIRGIITKAQSEGKRVCIVLSSMIHEVYSYGRGQTDSFWEMVWGFEPDYVAIRDMMVSSKTSRPAPVRNAMRIRQIYGRDIPNGAEMIAQHESIWGSLEENWSLTHFLLKYRYVGNWEREVHENYLPLNVEQMMGVIPSSYDMQYFDHFVLPFISGAAWRDFYIQMQDPTHVKMILRKVRKTPRKLDYN